jgi:hypothetical protein
MRYCNNLFVGVFQGIEVKNGKCHWLFTVFSAVNGKRWIGKIIKATGQSGSPFIGKKYLLSVYDDEAGVGVRHVRMD